MTTDETVTITDIAALLREITLTRHTPVATYRLQFHADFTFANASQVAPYLNELGISDLYASPILKARKGSTHGYDIVDHTTVNPLLGGEEGLIALSTQLREQGMGLLLDAVPNHMGIGDEHNLWWMDVLENGPSSIYASYFDIDWQPIRLESENKVLLPILGDQYGNVLERGELRLAYEEGSFFIYYYEHKLPVAPRTYSQILAYKLDDLVSELGDSDEHLMELQSILTAISYLPPQNESDPEKIAERNREKEIIKRRLATLYTSSPAISAAIDATVTAFNGTVGDPHSFDLMDNLIADQAFRPAFWRVSTEEINYRRFFDINDLAAICVELPDVFQATHQVFFRLLARGQATGLRIDHPDGLWNPPSYFRQLQETYLLHRIGELLAAGADNPAPEEVAAAIDDWLDTVRAKTRSSHNLEWPLYVIAEKILSEGESLPNDWAVDGTTGYDFLSSLNGMLIYSGSRRAFDKLYGNFVGQAPHFHQLVNSSKKMIMLVSLSSEINELSHRLERIAEKNRRYRDFTLNSVTFAMREVIAALPIYRTYITGPDDVARWEQKYIEAAVAEARRRNPRTAEAVFTFIRDSLLLRNLADFPPEQREELITFVMKFQQLTGPVMAKGVEDTSFYVYNRLVSLNEVGAHPEQYGVTVNQFHKQNADRQKRWPHSMLTTSTHDTKRSEDVRARINVLSEMPEAWSAALSRWGRQNARRKSDLDGMQAPDRNDEYLLYQSLVGAWPIERPDMSADERRAEFATFRERIVGYMQKATKEAKVHTSWINPNDEYDAAVRNFVLRVLDDRQRNPFLENVREFQRRTAYFGMFNALTQVLLKLTAPGVPDIYQGNELWDLSLVDPDNRRPVDYDLRRRLLSELQQQVVSDDLRSFARSLLDTSYDGRIKLYLVWRTLTFRRNHTELFAHGSYEPIEIDGDKHDHICAFTRIQEEEQVVVAVPRLTARLAGHELQPPLGAIWGQTQLIIPGTQAGQRFRNLYTNALLTVIDQDGIAELPAAEVFADFPVALLVRE